MIHIPNCMQATLRIQDSLYRDVKAQAAREGITLTRYFEEALLLRMKQGLRAHKKTRFRLPTFGDRRKSFDLSPQDIKALQGDPVEFT